MLQLYTLTLFLSALLLFSVQPMVGKMILPRFGGTSAVWNTCMVFFQVQLLVGYLYSHLSGRLLSPRWQLRLHLLMLALPVFFLPISFAQAGAPDPNASQNFWLLTQLTLVAGLPCLVVGTSAPLLQNWFSKTNHPSADDPYFLYAASNFGSLLALLAYPLLIEPSMTVHQQTTTWAVIYGVLAALTICCGIVMRRFATTKSDTRPTSTATPSAEYFKDVPTHRDRLKWVMLAFVPSSLMLGVTTFITTDIASAPLLWVIPLALFLLTFVLAFSPRLSHLQSAFGVAIPFVVLPMIPLLFVEMKSLAWLLVPVHLLVFFVIAMFCHGELARNRPTVGHLTSFYLWMSVGGVLGGAFNALLAPQIFSSVVEYPLAIVLACFLWSNSVCRQQQSSWFNRLDVVWSGGLAVVAMAIMLLVNGLGSAAGTPHQLAVFGLPALMCFQAKNRPFRFAAGYAIVLFLFANWLGQQQGDQLCAARGFYGVNRVIVDQSSGLRKLVHGRTVHGIQRISPEISGEPLAYYHRTGPMGDVFASFPDLRDVGVIGLGSGAAAAYLQPGQQFTFFEIDPIVKDIASDPRYFTYLQECPGQIRIVLGDARIRLAEVSDDSFDLLVLDAFSSDAIPTHLLTREALQLYLSKLRPQGILLCHVSNKFVELEPLLGNMAAESNLTCLRRLHMVGSELAAEGVFSSEYLLIAHSDADLEELKSRQGWQTAKTNPDLRAWTDDYSNVLSVFRW